MAPGLYPGVGARARYRTRRGTHADHPTGLSSYAATPTSTRDGRTQSVTGCIYTFLLAVFRSHSVTTNGVVFVCHKPCSEHTPPVRGVAVSSFPLVRSSPRGCPALVVALFRRLHITAAAPVGPVLPPRVRLASSASVPTLGGSVPALREPQDRITSRMRAGCWHNPQSRRRHWRWTERGSSRRAENQLPALAKTASGSPTGLRRQRATPLLRRTHFLVHHYR